MAKQRITNALSVKQPWAWAIMDGRKRIENRSKRTQVHLRERIAIHSSKRPVSNLKSLAAMLEDEATRQDCLDSPHGAILGTVEIVDCVDFSDDPAFVGPFGWVLARPRRLRKPIPARGAPGFWPIPPHIARRLR